MSLSITTIVAGLQSVRAIGPVERGLAKILSRHFNIEGVLEGIRLAPNYRLGISSCSSSDSDSHSDAISVHAGTPCSSLMVRKAALCFVDMDRLNGFEWLDPEVTTQSNIF